MVLPLRFHMLAGGGEYYCKLEQLTMPILEAWLPDLPRLLQRATSHNQYFYDEVMKQLTVPMMDVVIKKLISSDDTTTAMRVVMCALQNYPDEEPSPWKKAFLDAWYLAISTGQEGDFEQSQGLKPTDTASLAHAARVKFFSKRPEAAYLGFQGLRKIEKPTAARLQEIVQLREMLPDDPATSQAVRA